MSCYTHHTFLLGFPTGWSFTTHQALFLAPLPGTKEEYFRRLKKTSRVNLAPAALFLAPLPGT
jgi:hypothetical protein